MDYAKNEVILLNLNLGFYVYSVRQVFENTVVN